METEKTRWASHLILTGTYHDIGGFMKKIWLLLFGLLFTLTASAKLAFEVVNAGLDNQYVAICYHDVRDDVAKRFDDDQFATSTDELIRQFEWFAENGYHPVSVQQIIDASNGGNKLPEKAILLTFDDGYVSLYEKNSTHSKNLPIPSGVCVGHKLDRYEPRRSKTDKVQFGAR